MYISDPKNSKSRKRWFYTLVVFGLIAIVLRLIYETNLQDSAVLYLGIPLLIAVGLWMTPKRKSAKGAAFKGITIALLLSAPIFQEGYICILFAAPLFYTIGLIVAHQEDRARRRNEKGVKMQAAAVVTILALLSLEGTTDMTTIPRENTVIASKIVTGNITDVRKQLAKTPDFSGEKPFFLKIFPYPAEISGQGLDVGDERKAKFVAYKHIWWSRVEGDLQFKVTESTPDRIKFIITKDDSYVSHYLKWQSSEVFLEPIDANHTKVTWKHEYTRLLDPAWYFGPLQNYAVKLTTEQLIDYVATPKAAKS